MTVMKPDLEQQRRGNRRVGLALTALALAVFVTTIVRQWMSGGL